jgi:chemotaxis family two-component system response regulator Rcp1
MRPSVVVTGPRLRALGTLADRLRRRLLPDVDVDAVVPVEACARQVAGRDVRLLLGCIEAPRDLQPLRAFRRENPGLPIVVTGSRLRPLPERPALPEGPTSWAPSMHNAAAVVRHLQEVIGLRKAVDDGRARIDHARALVRETRKLMGEHRRLKASLERNLNRTVRPRFAPLLVEGDPDEALRLVRAFEKADAPAPAGIVGSGREAIAHLAGRAEGRDRSKGPLPTLVLLDFHLADRPGLDVLSWIRTTPATQCLPVVVLGRGLSAEEVARAYALRANSVLAKPEGFDDAVEMARALYYYWTRVNIVANAP